MHIPNGFLSDPVCAVSTAASLAALGVGFARARQTDDSRSAALMAATGAGIFAAQMVNFPIQAGTSGHVIGAALAAILLGPWRGMLTMAVVLAVQCFAFGDGGASTLGANILNMAVAGTLSAWALYTLVAGRVSGTRGKLVGRGSRGLRLGARLGDTVLGRTVRLGNLPAGRSILGHDWRPCRDWAERSFDHGGDFGALSGRRFEPSLGPRWRSTAVGRSRDGWRTHRRDGCRRAVGPLGLECSGRVGSRGGRSAIRQPGHQFLGDRAGVCRSWRRMAGLGRGAGRNRRRGIRVRQQLYRRSRRHGQSAQALVRPSFHTAVAHQVQCRSLVA